jgi:hypothetical protein
MSSERFDHLKRNPKVTYTSSSYGFLKFSMEPQKRILFKRNTIFQTIFCDIFNLRLDALENHA